MGRTARRWLPALVVLAVLVALVVGSGATDGRSAAPTTTGLRPPSSAAPATVLPMPTTVPTIASTIATTSGPSTTTTTPPAPTTAAAPVDRLAVVVADPLQMPYRRAAFGRSWDYDPSTGCNTRELVLIEESLTPPVLRERCHPVSGSWRSTYDGVFTTDPTALEIDHLVPLADAWRSGAATWSDEQRRAFANDRTDPATLVAVTSHTNRSKSDRSPDQWLPPDLTDHCAYAEAWVGVKVRWQLAVTLAEKATLVQVLAGC